MRRILLRAAAIGLAAVAITVTAAGTATAHKRGPAAKHVLLLSVDGLHQSDVQWYIKQHPHSTFAMLARKGVEFTHAQTPFPSDSFPGMVGQVTGGDPRTTGVYYDDSWNHSLLPAGTTSCAGVKPGAEVTYFEAADRNPLALDAGQGLTGLPDGILQMTGSPTSLLDPAQLPVDAATCKPVYPHQYLKVNTIFEVARAAGLRTAWSDKHPAYEILNGPSGTGIQDLFTPEINSEAPTPGSPDDWTTDNGLTMRYDSYKVRATLNEIDGLDHSGTSKVGTPAIFGMNFQTVSTAEKLPTSDGLTGGYLPGGTVPGPLLSRALDYVDAQIGSMAAEIKARGLQGSTVIIVSAKHGQSPQEPEALTRIPDGPIVDALNAAWTAAHPGSGDLVAFSIDDDAMLMWLNDRSPAATAFARAFLLAHSGTGNDINGNPKPYTSSGLQKAYAGADAAAYFGVATNDPRVPDVLGIVQHGVVYTGKQGKIAEHGGTDPQDRGVPLLVSGKPLAHGHWRHVLASPVETTQIAPTILQLLGLDPGALQAVQIQGTQSLPLG
ncbi:MAG TPA: alkaline phosphatase family protein [Gaiellales bacterium]|nr:alkaline phosphatase family protein [Gaiellales bacterium]